MSRLPLFALFTLLAPWGAQALDLAGKVTDQVAGIPLSGVTVIILAAGPRDGTSPLCPYSYPDCGKQAISDDTGHFRLPSVDPSMDFCIVTLTPGFAPGIYSKLLPEKGPVEVKLQARDLMTIPSEHIITGRIIGPSGEPVVGAMLEVDGVTKGDVTMWGSSGKVDSMTVSDLQGEFHIVSTEDFVSAGVLVTSMGRSPRWFRLEPGKMSLLRLKAGASIRGRLLADGKPFAGIRLSAATAERQSGKFINNMNTVTDEDGKFAFANVPANEKLQIFGLMGGMSQSGKAFRMDVTAGADGQATELGDVTAASAYRITGQVILADGQPIPPNTRLMLDRRAAWDTQLATIEKDGKFTMQGVPGEKISLTLSVPGYRMSPRNPNLNIWNRSSLSGLVRGNIDGLKIVLEPGNALNPGWADFESPSSEAIAASENKPFTGAP